MDYGFRCKELISSSVGSQEHTAKLKIDGNDSTFLRLADSSQLPPDFVRCVEEIEYTNGYIQIHLTIKSLPEFTGHMEFVNGTPQSYLMAYIKSPEQLAVNGETITP